MQPLSNFFETSTNLRGRPSLFGSGFPRRIDALLDRTPAPFCVRSNSSTLSRMTTRPTRILLYTTSLVQVNFLLTIQAGRDLLRMEAQDGA